MTKAEACQQLGISERTLDKYARSVLGAVRMVKGKTSQRADFNAEELEQIGAAIIVAQSTQQTAQTLQGTVTADFADDGQGGTGTGTELALHKPANLALPRNGVPAGFPASQVLVLAPEHFPALAETLAQALRDGAAPVVPIEQKSFLSIAEAAELAGVGASAIEAAVKSGALVAHKGLARGRRIKRADLDAWAKAL